MCDNLDKQTVDWHSGFYAAAKVMPLKKMLYLAM